jgi:hypothetical protein
MRAIEPATRVMIAVNTDCKKALQIATFIAVRALWAVFRGLCGKKDVSAYTKITCCNTRKVPSDSFKGRCS